MASPNPSTSPSVSSPPTSRTVSPSRTTHSNFQTQGQARRPNNRVALRDYYNLKSDDGSSTAASKQLGLDADGSRTSTSSNSNSNSTTNNTNNNNNNNNTATQQASSSKTSPRLPENPRLDSPSFDPKTHVQTLLSTSSLTDLLRAESGLINEIKGLDGERKALVYDNYSKLITATETIGKMRRNMDPLTPTTGNLDAAVRHIAETATGLLQQQQQQQQQQRQRQQENDGTVELGLGVILSAQPESQQTSKVVGTESDVNDVDKQNKENPLAEGDGRGNTSERKREKQVATVKWVLGTPRRLVRLKETGQKEKADQDWGEVRTLLEKWKGVGGVEEVKDQCEKIMARS